MDRGADEPGRRGLPFLVRFLLLHAVVGFGLATVAVAGLLWADPGGLATLLTRAAGHPGPLLLLWFFLGLILGNAQMGAAFMLRTGSREDGPEDRSGGGRRQRTAVPQLLGPRLAVAARPAKARHPAVR